MALLMHSTVIKIMVNIPVPTPPRTNYYPFYQSVILGSFLSPNAPTSDVSKLKDYINNKGLKLQVLKIFI